MTTKIKVDLGGEYWVKVSTEWDNRDGLAFAAYTMSGERSVEDEALFLMHRAIIEWNLTDEDGVTLPINEANLNTYIRPGTSSGWVTKIAQAMRANGITRRIF